jgi:alkylhydroperoxidase/carboxymuconolactone decarboxylase family protein YurZ
MTEPDDLAADLPAMAGELARARPDIWKAHVALGEACAAAGPLDPRSQRLVKLALCLGAGLEGGAHSHTRRALQEGHDIEALRHIALLAVPTCGFPAAMRMLSWIDDFAPDAEPKGDHSGLSNAKDAGEAGLGG